MQKVRTLLKRNKIGLFAFIFLSSLPCPLRADDNTAISDVRIEGNVRVPSAVILNTIMTKKGAVYNPAVIRKDIGKLYERGDFSDIKVEKKETAEGIELTFRVTEKYIVGKIVFSGNRAVRSKRLKKDLLLKKGKPYDSWKLKEDKLRIAALYRQMGFAGVQVKPQVDTNEEEKEVSVTFNIEEGTVARIKKVKFEGNKVLTDRQLKAQIKTGGWTLFSRKIFHEDILNEDKERILSYYGKKGYIKAEIPEIELKYGELGKTLTVIFYIKENSRYFTGKIKLENNLRKETKLRSGAPFNPYQLDKDKRRVYDYLYEKGYMYAAVRVDEKIREETKLVDVTYEIDKSMEVYIEEIKISGNVRTKDKIIRREILIKPGDRFDLKKIRTSHRRLRNLGRKQPFFESVTFEIEDGTALNRKNVLFKVTEGKTGYVLFGGGYSTVDKFVGFIEVDVENFDMTNPPSFAGGGQSLSIRGEVGTVKTDYRINFSEPWIFDKPVSFGFNLYDRTRDWDDYDEQRKGTKLAFGHRLAEFNNIRLMGRYENVDIYNIDPDASEEIKKEEGKRTISSVLLGLSRDSRDDSFNPRNGVNARISTELAGNFLGGNTDFTRNIGSVSWYIPTWGKTCVNLRLEGGLVEEYGDSDEVPIYERFFMGGPNSVRGYAYRSIGPKDDRGEPIGGKVKLQANIEYIIPLVKDLRGAIFYDTGNVWSSREDFDIGDLYSGVGVGIRLMTPIGPIRIDYGYGININHGRIDFTVGWPF